MSAFSHFFVIFLTVASIIGCGWLMWWTAYARDSASVTKPTGNGEPGKTGHVWDEDIEEYNNPMPRWWLWLFIITLVFSVGYLVLYPGLGNFAGSLGWSQVSEHKSDQLAAQSALERHLAELKSASISELSINPKAMSLAQNLFAANCSTCHGSDARGARGFPNLTDKDWLYGGDPDSIYQSIANGRHGIMPALGSALGKQGINEVTSYVFELSRRNAPKDWAAAGKSRFETLCAACHGATGTGNPLLGAPNLTDAVWLHGEDLDAITATISNGRDNKMPAHLPLLGETKVRLLAAYVVRLSSTQDTVSNGE